MRVLLQGGCRDGAVANMPNPPPKHIFALDSEYIRSVSAGEVALSDLKNETLSVHTYRRSMNFKVMKDGEWLLVYDIVAT